LAAKKSKNRLQNNLKYEILGVFLFALAFFLLVSIFTSTGLIGAYLLQLLTIVTGEKGCYLVSGVLFYFAWAYWRHRKPVIGESRSKGVLLLLALSLTVLHLAIIPAETPRRVVVSSLWDAGLQGQGGGVLGALFSMSLYYLLARPGTVILIIALGIIDITLLTGIPSSRIFQKLGAVMVKAGQRLKLKLEQFLFIEEEEEDVPSIRTQRERTQREGDGEGKRNELPVIIDSSESGVPPLVTEESEAKEAKRENDVGTGTSAPQAGESNRESYTLPPLTLLRKPIKVKSSRLNKDLIENVRILEETLDNFGIKVCVNEVHRGPAITRYEVQPAPGVKVSRIVRLADDIALSLAAPDVRIEAPIPGKSALGIEVPNKEVSTVYLREILETPEFQDAASKLTFALGKDIAGNPVVADLMKMPHLLIAGATGSGKSVCLNAIICSLIFKAAPSEVKFLLIDPKMVELITYNGIPHLLAPVVTDPKKAAGALKWVVSEMVNRYETFSSLGVRDINRYNKLLSSRDPRQHQPLPYIVVIIDELSDLMMVSPVDVEDAICRLAQMARAAGIHLVIATQRPSVDVITGVIKANIPSRISFAVSSQIDSRTILDLNGAEKLLGRGDMLFMPVGAIKPIRIQGALVTEKEVEDVVAYLVKHGEPVYLSEFPSPDEEDADKEVEYGDSLVPEAAKVVIDAGHASVSLLQRRLRIGYSRAARLMDILEAKGVVGPYEGAKPREVLMTVEQYHRYFGR
jgi:S-DNA-T family DNA segregation ATPase FtsK/SpoIIIE